MPAAATASVAPLGMPKKTTFLTTAKPAGELPTSEFIKAIIYGNPGVGKTTFACGAPDPFLIDIDRGNKSLNTMGLGHVQVALPDTLSEVEGIFWEAKSAPGYKQTYIIDTITELQRYHLDEIAQAEVMARKRDRFVNSQQDYNESTNLIRKIGLMFRELPANIIFIAHSIEDKDESTGAYITRPALTPKLSGTLEGMVDLVGYMEIGVSGFGANETYSRTLRAMPTRRISAKNRLGLPTLIENPSWAGIVDLAAKAVKGKAGAK